MLHVPISLRLRGLRAARQCYNRMADGDPKWSILAEAGESLITASLPRGVLAPTEVSERLGMWQFGQISALLVRIEQQAIVFNNQRNRGCKRTSKDQEKATQNSDTGHTIRVAAEGAYRKAVVGLTSDLMRFGADEDRAWADELIPCSQRGFATFTPAPDSAMADQDRTPFAEDRSQYASPLKGVRFSKMTGPGPTARCPEHFQDFLKCQRRREVNLFLLSLGRLHAAMASGTLPDEGRWLTRTRLCWQKKKNKKPRPIQMTEVIRSSFGKRYIKQYAKQIRRAMSEEHQWGISVPGACESLSHWRGTIEDIARSGEIEPVIIADLDQVNMFGNAEWESIRQSVDCSRDCCLD